MKKIYVLIFAILAVVSCTKEQSRDMSGLSRLVIEAGCEEKTSADTKTYIKDASAGTIWWGNTDQDRVLYVFDDAGVKNALTSSSTTVEAVRTFSSDSWSGGDWKYAVWTGYTQAKDECSLNGSVLSGPNLKVQNPQTITNSKSFNNTANIAVMKPTDEVMRNVFGYLRFSLPTYPGSSLAGIKSVTFKADENVAGEIMIDYSGTAPVVSVISNENASKTLTLNTRYKAQGPQGYEPGVVWMVLPAGTYHNASLTITPFTSDPVAKDATVGEPFTVNFIGNVVIKRSQYTDSGTLPLTDSSSDQPDEPEKVIWPNDTDAFDYGMSVGSSKVVDMSGYKNVIATDSYLSTPVTLDKVTYCGNESKFRNKPCFTANRAKLFTKIGGLDFPTTATQNFFFKINRPGTISYFPRMSSTAKNPRYIVALVKTTESGTVAKYIFDGLPKIKSSSESDMNKDECRITVNITAADMQGMTEAATVYVFHLDVGDVTSYYPFTWTVAE